MSFIDKLGETLQDAGWFVGAPVAAAIDVAKAALPGGTPFTQGAVKAVVQGFDRGTQLFTGDQTGDDAGTQNLVSPAFNKAMDGLDWVYREGISRPLNFVNVEEQRLLADVGGIEDNASVMDLGSAWDRASNTHGGYDGKGTSIGRESSYTGQAAMGLLTPFLGDKNKRLAPLTDEGQRALNEGHGVVGKSFDIESGLGDFIGRVFLDPTVVGGKAFKAVRVGKLIAGIKDPTEIASKLANRSDGLFAGFGTRFDDAIKFQAAPGRTAGELIAAHPAYRESMDGEQMAAVVEQTNKAMRLAGKTDDEIESQLKLVNRAWLGDADALRNIDDSAGLAKDALAAMQSSRDDLKTASEWAVKYSDRVTPEDIQDAAQHLNLVKDLELRGQDYLTSDEFLKLTNARLETVSRDIRAAEQEAARQRRIQTLFRDGPTGEVKSTFGGGKDQPFLSSVLGTNVPFAGGARQLERAAARERGEQAGLDFVFQSTAWNKGVKVLAPHIWLMQRSHAAFGRMAAPGAIDVTDDKAGQSLNAWLKHTAIDPERRLELVSRLAGTQSKVQRGAIIDEAIKKGVDSSIAAHRAKNPLMTDDAEKLVRTAIQKQLTKDGSRTGIQSQMFTAAKRGEDTDLGPAGSRGDMITDDDGMVNFYPILDTQLTSIYRMPNLKNVDHILNRHANWITDMAEWARGNRAPDPSRIDAIGQKVFGGLGHKMPKLADQIANFDDHKKSVNDFAWKSEEVAKMMLDGFNRLWKAGTLAPRAPAYAVRVNVDSGMRFAATMGPAAYLMHAAPRVFGHATLGSASAAKMLFRARADDAAQLKLQKAMERIEDAYAGSTGKKLVAGVDVDYDAMKAQHEEITKRLDLFHNGGRKGRRQAYGAIGEPGQKSIQTRAGEIEGAFTGPQGVQNRSRILSETSAALMDDMWKLGTKDAQTGNWGYVLNSDPKHMENWLHAVNAQLMQSSVGKEAVRLMVEYDGDMAKASSQLARWATGTAEGRKLMGELVWTARDKKAYTNEIVGYVNHYLPSRELQQEAHASGRVTQQSLETAIPDPLNRPPVHGEALATAVGRGDLLGAMLNKTTGRILRWAGDATEDQLARMPMYAAVYEQEAKRRAEFLMADPRITHVDGLDIKRLIQDQAHKKARQAIKNYMFDIAATSDLSHMMRFTSPFVAAWEDTIRKWGRIAKENPDQVARGLQLWNAPNALGLVVDEDGNPVEKDGILGYTDPKTGEKKSTYIVIPRGLTKWIPGAGDSQLKISKQSLNIVLQGGIQPGFGPLVAYPVGKLQTAAPQLDQVAQLVNPFGPPNSFYDAVAPSVLKSLTDATNDQSRTHAQDTQRIWAQMLAEYRLDPSKFGGKQPTIDEASSRAGALGRLKILNRVVGVPIAGFPATFQSPYQLYIDSYHVLKDREHTENHPVGWADDEFVRQFGDSYFPLVQSMSVNNAGLGASAEAVEASKKYKDLISKYGIEAGQADPNLIRLIVGQEGEGDYNDSAHQWQETRQISPASGINFRSYDNPQQAMADADASLGWLKYRQKMNELDARAIQDGYRTYADDPDLVDERKQFIDSLSQENQAWHVDWSQRDSDKFERDLKSLGEIADSGKFGPMRTDMVGVKQYLALRQAFQDEVTQYGISPTSKDAQPFRQEFTDAVMDLVSSNSQFAEWSYYTFLDRDPLLEPLTSQEQPTDQQPTDWGIG